VKNGSKISWPQNRRFAFTIFDDTDWATVKNVRPVYDFLRDLGIRTTKSVWISRGKGRATNRGMTCEDREYLGWVHSLQDQGFEIGFHNAAPTTSNTRQTREGLDRFRALFGDQKIVHCNHVGCLENIYWGDARLSGWRRHLYNLLTGGRRRELFRGHVEGDPLFWGDLCQERVRYVRNFVFDDLNMLALCPELPYHDAARPYVDFWFPSINGGSLECFLRNFTRTRVDRLVEDGGLALVYVHFAAGFASDGRVRGEFRKRMEYLASKDGFFAPVSVILDFLRKGQNPTERVIEPKRLSRLETRWLLNRVLKGTV